MNAENNKQDTFLSFVLDDEFYGIEILRVREILDYQPLTKIPLTPEYMKGVVNIRGNAVPVVDLRQKFGISPIEVTLETRVIIIELCTEQEDLVLGVITDSVREVLELPDDMINPPPKMGGSNLNKFIQGVGKVGDQFIMNLKFEELFSGEELSVVKTMQEEAEVKGMPPAIEDETGVALKM